MKTVWIFILAFLLPCYGLYAYNDDNAVGGQSAGIAKAAINLTDVFSIFSNQAGLAGIQKLSVGLYSENRFLVEGLNTYAVGAALPTKSGTFGVGVTYFGDEALNHTRGSLSYGRYLGEKLSVGGQLDVVSLGTQNYGSAIAFTFGLGLQFQVLDNLNAGAHVYNPLQIKLTDAEEDNLPTILRFGLDYAISEKVNVVTEVEKNMEYDAIFKAGLNYCLINQLSVRAGISTNPSMVYLGLGIKLKTIHIDAAVSYHNVLGYSPHISIIYRRD